MKEVEGDELVSDRFVGICRSSQTTWRSDFMWFSCLPCCLGLFFFRGISPACQWVLEDWVEDFVLKASPCFVVVGFWPLDFGLAVLPLLQCYFSCGFTACGLHLLLLMLVGHFVLGKLVWFLSFTSCNCGLSLSRLSSWYCACSWFGGSMLWGLPFKCSSHWRHRST